MKTETNISLKTPQELEILREAGHILASIIQEIRRSLKTGVTTKEIDARAEKLMDQYKVIPAFKGYCGFPNSICISINEEVVHGIPSNRVLHEGDIASLDIGIIFKQFYADTAISVGIGELDPESQKLLDITEQSLYRGIVRAQVGSHLSDISHAIQTFVEGHQFSIVREYVGHGIGRKLHEDPEIPNFGPPHRGPVLQEGMVLAIEPMVNQGSWQTQLLKDGWTVVTKDGKPSAHFEHTIAVTRSGPQILTQIHG